MYVAVARVRLLLHGCASLKDKRRLLNRLRDRVRDRFSGVAVAEVGDQDLWNRAEVGLAAVSGDGPLARQVVSSAVEFIDQLHLGEIADDEVDLLQV